jgi:transposase
MPKRHRGPYPPEFRRRIVELVRAGRSPESLAKEFEPSAPAIRSWVHQADLDAGTRTDGVTSQEREELARLRREVKTLREEREILKKFAAWSVQESSRTPPKRSGS